MCPIDSYMSTFEKDDEQDRSSDVYACMRASESIGLLETEAGVPEETERAH